MKSDNSDSEPKLPFEQVQEVLDHDEAPDTLNLGTSSHRTPDITNQGTPDISNQGTPDISNQGTPDISNLGTPDISNQGTPDISNQGTPDISNQGTLEHEFPDVLTGDQLLGLSPADSALGEGSSLPVSDEEEAEGEGEGEEEGVGGVKEGEEVIQSDQLEGDQLEGDELEGNQLEGDQFEGVLTLEENVERSPSPANSSPSVGTPETSRPAILCDSTADLPTPFDGSSPTTTSRAQAADPFTTSPADQAADPFSGEVPETITYHPAANPFDVFDEIDSSCREVTPRPEDGQGGNGVISTLPIPPNQFDSYRASSTMPGGGPFEDDRPSMPGGGPFEDDLPEEESLSDFALETASYSSSLDLSCLLEATLEPTALPRGSPSYLQVQEDHFSPEVGALIHQRCSLASFPGSPPAPFRRGAGGEPGTRQGVH